MNNFELHEGQSEIFNDLFIEQNCRYAVAACTRGWGKSFMGCFSSIQAVSELEQASARNEKKIYNKNVSIIAPTASQAMSIYTPILMDVLELGHRGVKCNLNNGEFKFPYGTTLKLWSYEGLERMRGTGQYFVVCDEISSWEKAPGPQETWMGVIKPCITTRWSEEQAAKHGLPGGRALFISTPKGYNYFYDLYCAEEADDDWKSYHYTYEQAPHLSNEEIEKERATIDPLKFSREYLASFEESGNNVFYNFDRKKHVRDDLPWFDAEEDVHVAIDFNTGIMAWSAAAIRGDQIHWLADGQGQPNTTELAKFLKKKFKGHKIIAYPDASGRAMKTSAATGITDFKILQSEGIDTRARRKQPPIVDSVQAVNNKLLSANASTTMWFSNQCTFSIRSMERTVWNESNMDNAAIDKSNNDEHWSDGIRYLTEFLFPVRAGTRSTFNTNSATF